MAELLAALVRAGILTQDEANSIGRVADADLGRRLAEQELAAAIQRGLTEQQARLLDFIRAHDYDPSARAFARFWAGEDRILASAWVPILQQIASERGVIAAIESGSPSMWNRVNEAIIDWAQDYYINPDATYLGSIPNLNNAARTVIGNAFSAWHRGELEVPSNVEGLPRLIVAMEEVFGPERGARIAVTEVTRIHAEAERMAALQNPNVEYLIWHTAADEKVCPLCGPLHARIVGKRVDGFDHPTLGVLGFPPLHPNCRCGVQGISAAVAGLPRPPEEQWRYSGPMPTTRGERVR